MLNVLNPATIQLVHEKSLDILENIGIEIKSEKLLSMLAEHLTVDFSVQRVRFPRTVVENALKAAPRSFTLGGLDPRFDAKLGAGERHVATDGQGCFCVDIKTGARRNSTMADLVDAALISEHLDHIHIFWPPVTAQDVPEGSRTIRELVACWRHMGKHFQTDCFSEAQAVYYEKVLQQIFGGPETLRSRHPFSLVCCPVSPLCFEAEMLEGTVYLGGLDVPVVVLPMPISGVSAPMTMLGTVIQNNAETLAGITILELLHPGRPVIYGAAPGILDMTTSLFCVGAPEGALQNAAGTEMARYYGLPSLSCGGGSDAKAPGIQSTMERMIGMLPLFMEGADIICGVGLTETAQCLHLDELILSADIAGYCRRFAEGIRGEESLALSEDVQEAGPGGDFLSMESTVEHLRSGEHFFPKYINRESYDGWMVSPKKDISGYAKQKALEILALERREYFGPELLIKLEAILQEADVALAE